MGNTSREPGQPTSPTLTCRVCGKALVAEKVGTYGMYDAWYYGCPDECVLASDEPKQEQPAR